ncbi:hypothetical protein [Noviherbaspirillum denitrificans]|uniref:hypothetical protein n=1 Tax=Noviherbaspirillum denitrificans TaxID=1968433 RepID=UPI001482232E|nr:hypothetical protein [Noviherbaspirillum denitrificans]
MVTQEQPPAREHELLVMNLEAGLAGVVPVMAADREEAIRLYERANPACVVITGLAPGD